MNNKLFTMHCCLFCAVVRYVLRGSTAVVTRPDRLSSVIRRFPQNAEDDMDAARTVSGFCECGWPYHMLLPRGTPAGQRPESSFHLSQIKR